MCFVRIITFPLQPYEVDTIGFSVENEIKKKNLRHKARRHLAHGAHDLPASRGRTVAKIQAGGSGTRPPWLCYTIRTS